MVEVCEIFTSIQGESSRAGMTCTFVRLAGCNLSCRWCDTPYARESNRQMTLDAVVEEVDRAGCSLVEITGGEPLLQKETPELCRRLIDGGNMVLVETNGSLPVNNLPETVVKIVDVKCPGSGEEGSFCEANIDLLTPSDELKFVLSGRADFEWACSFVKRHDLENRVQLLFSPQLPDCSPRDCAGWILDARPPVRLNLQLHTLIWGREVRGV